MVPNPTLETLVCELLDDYPQCLRVFLDHKMHCVGCQIAPYHTLRDACTEHSVDSALFLKDIARVVALS